jgi:hypothetical protein
VENRQLAAGCGDLLDDPDELELDEFDDEVSPEDDEDEDVAGDELASLDDEAPADSLARLSVR